MSNQVASTVSTNIVPVQGQFDQNGNCQGLIGPGGEVFFPPLVGDAITGVTIDNSVIGSNTAASGTFTSLNVMSLASLNGKLIMSSTPPTIASGFGGANATITANSTAAFKVVVGNTTTSSTGVLTFPTAPNGWVVQGWDITQGTAVFLQQTAFTTTSATIGCFNITTGGSANFAASDIVIFTATAF